MKKILVSLCAISLLVGCRKMIDATPQSTSTSETVTGVVPIKISSTVVHKIIALFPKASHFTADDLFNDVKTFYEGFGMSDATLHEDYSITFNVLEKSIEAIHNAFIDTLESIIANGKKTFGDSLTVTDLLYNDNLSDITLLISGDEPAEADLALSPIIYMICLLNGSFEGEENPEITVSFSNADKETILITTIDDYLHP